MIRALKEDGAADGNHAAQAQCSVPKQQPDQPGHSLQDAPANHEVSTLECRTPASPQLFQTSGSQPSTLNHSPSDQSSIALATEDQLPFQRFPGETPRAFSAFITWFQFGHARSHQAVADKLGEGLPTVKNWASKYDWSQRLLHFNSGLLQQQAADSAERQRKQAADWAARLNRFREQEWDAAQKLLSAAQCFLETFGDAHVQNMNLSQVSRAISISSDIARSAVTGLELPPSSEPALAPVQQQMLEALQRLSGQPAASQTHGKDAVPCVPN
ncbi:MAG TPA: hypothetical protein VLT36_02950 [Candidatus Dormibacteraeota bacterium]|nr:hypothetical protein [Candidatus Dormibacteraeota bacterium]